MVASEKFRELERFIFFLGVVKLCEFVLSLGNWQNRMRLTDWRIFLFVLFLQHLVFFSILFI